MSKVINALEGLRKVTIPAKESVLHAYCHFEALTSHDYSFSCVCCGYYPPVVVMDLHKKGVFNFPGKSVSCVLGGSYIIVYTKLVKLVAFFSE